MNRKIKFRAWIKSYESMIKLKPTQGRYDFEDGFVQSFVVDGYAEFGAHERYDVDKDDMIVMQFTGEKDKNSKWIYEGDIITGTAAYKNVKGVVDFVYGSFGIEDFHLHEIGGIEVIGNIYQNPELIK